MKKIAIAVLSGLALALTGPVAAHADDSPEYDVSEWIHVAEDQAEGAVQDTGIQIIIFDHH